MTLPGRLTVGFLDEDNPLKSFFRMRPILTEDADGFSPSETDDRFPEEGFIRIVPDKNEMTMFKVRMRQLGRYCALDLRKHLSENDKIRPNKNYIFGGPEHNQYIVYSDVIGRVPPHLIAEIIEIDDAPVLEQLEAALPMPGTIYVLVKRDNQLSGPWSWSMDATGLLQLRHAMDQPFSELPLAVRDGKVMDVPLTTGGSAQLMYDLSAFELGELTPQEFERIVDSGLFGAPSLHSSYRSELPADRPMVPGVDSFRGMEQTIAPELQTKAVDAPWLARSELLRPRAVNSRLSLREQAIQAQSGFNPRRGRSLHEVVDEQWRKSRYDQLGHPVPGQATGRPIASPIERATNALTEAWSLNEARPTLLSELLKNDELREALCERLQIAPGASGGELSEQLNDLEAQRLALLGEIDAIKHRRDEAKSSLMDEMTRANEAQIAALTRRIDSLNAELKANERAAKAARDTAELTEQMLSESNDALDDRLKTALFIQRLEAHRAPVATHPDIYEPTAGELISDVRLQMEHAGFPLSNDGATNLLACMVSGSAVILSGPCGSGKTAMARNFAAALGLTGESGRFAQVRDPGDPAVKALLDESDGITPLMVLIDDFNTGDCQQRILDIMALQESAASRGAPLCLLLTAQDAPEGRPLPPRLLDRSFLVRLKGATADAPWQSAAAQPLASGRAVSLSALKHIFRPEADLPAAMAERLDKLRAALAKLDYAIDRRTLGEMWTYCASAIGHAQCTPLELLDIALAQRAVPAMLASMEVDALHELPKLIVDLPRSLALLDQPLPLPPL